MNTDKILDSTKIAPCPHCGAGGPLLAIAPDPSPEESEALAESLAAAGYGPLMVMPGPKCEVRRVPVTGIVGAFADVLAFHRKFRCVIGETPAVPAEGTAHLRSELITEEYQELLSALMRGDLAGVADGALDLIYVVLGTLASYGIDPGRPWQAIQAANMAKENGGTRDDGKVMKPPGWVAPDIGGILRDQRPLSETYPDPAT